MTVALRARRRGARGQDRWARGAGQPEPGERFHTSDGTALSVTESGPESAPATLVLLHGWTQDHRTWDPVLERLPDSVRTLRYDARGHGWSAHARAGTTTIERLADDLAELVTSRVPEGKVVLAGHSMGGMTLMALAERHPRLVAERVAGMAFVATSSGEMNRITLGLPGLAGSGIARFERVLARLLAAVRRDTLPLRPALVRPGARLVFGRRPRKVDRQAVAAQLLRAHPASIGGFQNAIAAHDRRVALGALRGTPAVVLAGDLDRLCPLKHARVIARELPDADFVHFPGAGHMLCQERAQEVATRITMLLKTGHSSTSGR